MTNTNINVGDEYSSTEINVRIIAQVTKKDGKIDNKNCLENLTNSYKYST